MEDKVSDLIYSVRQLIESLKESDFLEKDEEVKDSVVEVEALLDEMTDLELEEDI